MQNEITDTKRELSNSDPLVQIRNLSVEFGQQAVLRNINLNVGRGETLAIIGESGCGKTVLLKSIIGLIHPTRGDVLFDQHNLSQLNDQQLTQQRIRFGFVFNLGSKAPNMRFHFRPKR